MWCDFKPMCNMWRPDINLRGKFWRIGGGGAQIQLCPKKPQYTCSHSNNWAYPSILIPLHLSIHSIRIATHTHIEPNTLQHTKLALNSLVAYSIIMKTKSMLFLSPPPYILSIPACLAVKTTRCMIPNRHNPSLPYPTHSSRNKHATYYSSFSCYLSADPTKNHKTSTKQQGKAKHKAQKVRSHRGQVAFFHNFPMRNCDTPS